VDNNLTYVIVAFLITGLVIGAYLLTLSRQVHNVREEYEALSGEADRRPPEPAVISKPRPTTPGKTQA
jgi:CcmD family protein